MLTRASRVVSGRSAAVLAALAVVGATAAALGLLGLALNPDDLAVVLDGARARPAEVAAAAACFLGAFSLRAQLWARMTPGLRFGHALAAILVATGANHVLPLRLGEPLRVVSVVTRTGIDSHDATVSTVALRVGDILALLAIGLVLGPGLVLDVLGWWGLPVVGAVTAVGLLALARVSRAVAAGRLQRPDLLTVAGTLAAWLAEAVLVWRVAQWAGADLAYHQAVLVTAVAVAAQLLALTPGGVGTYEAASAGALVVAGLAPGPALAVAVATHGTKTVLTVGAGLAAVAFPRPPLYGRLRLPRRSPTTPLHRPGTAPAGAIEEPEPGDVVLFLPAHNEGPRVAEVIARAPSHVAGHPVRVLVVDDGSTDDTAAAAGAAGAEVIAHGRNRGLGAAVATGLRAACDHGAVVVAFCDADGEYDPAQLEQLVAPVLAGQADYVVGSRFAGTIEHMQARRRWGNRALTRWVAWMSRLPVTDGQSGYRALSRAAASAAVVAHDYNYAQVLTLDLARKGFRYHEVPIAYRFRRSGDSFVRLGRYLARCGPAAWRVLNDRIPCDPDGLRPPAPGPGTRPRAVPAARSRTLHPADGCTPPTPRRRAAAARR